MFVQFLYEGEVLWLNELSVKNENFVGRVLNHPVNRGLMFGQMTQILFVVYWMFYIKIDLLNINIMFANKTKSSTDGKTLTPFCMLKTRHR